MEISKPTTTVQKKISRAVVAFVRDRLGLISGETFGIMQRTSVGDRRVPETSKLC